MNSTVPLPAPEEIEIMHESGAVAVLQGYSAKSMRTHAAAQSAADNAVLREQLAAAMNQFALEETDNAALRERVKVLEDALHMVGLLRRLGGILPSSNHVVQLVVEAARVALEKPP